MKSDKNPIFIIHFNLINNLYITKTLKSETFYKIKSPGNHYPIIKVPLLNIFNLYLR